MISQKCAHRTPESDLVLVRASRSLGMYDGASQDSYAKETLCLAVRRLLQYEVGASV